jgi:hypothetical protein
MIHLGLILDGSRAAADRIRLYRVQHEGAYRGAVYLFAQEVVSTAQKLCPVDTGFLRKSRYVRRPEIHGDRFEIEVGFSAPYAMAVHEMHRRYVVGEWKFLQTAITHHAQRALDRIAALTASGAASGLTADRVPAIHPTEPTTEARVARRHSPRIKAKRDASRDRNEDRIRRESRAALGAQRGRVGAPRPGRG